MRWTILDASFEVFKGLTGSTEFSNGNIIKKARRCLLEDIMDTLIDLAFPLQPRTQLSILNNSSWTTEQWYPQMLLEA